MKDNLSNAEKIRDCAIHLLSCSSPDNVCKALNVLFSEDVMDLRKISPGVDTHFSEMQGSVTIDDAFLDNLQKAFPTKALKDDFNLCRAYFARTIKDAQVLLHKLYEDELIGAPVRHYADLEIQHRLSAIALSGDQPLYCFRILVDELLGSLHPTGFSVDNTLKEDKIAQQQYNDFSVLNRYRKLFSSLSTAFRSGKRAPHKMILLLSIISLIEKNHLPSNIIYLTELLESEFYRLWEIYVGCTNLFTANIAMPFWHMEHEPFWSLYRKDGKNLDTLKSPYSVNTLRDKTYAKIDDELFDLLQKETSRNSLKQVLVNMFPDTYSLVLQNISLDL